MNEETVAPGYRNTDPDTSQRAYEETDTKTVEAKVKAVIFRYGDQGCIMDDIGRQLPQYRLGTISPRFIHLMEKGIIEDTGERRKGLTRKHQRVVRFVAEEDRPAAIARFKELEDERLKKRINALIAKRSRLYGGPENGATYD